MIFWPARSRDIFLKKIFREAAGLPVLIKRAGFGRYIILYILALLLSACGNDIAEVEALVEKFDTTIERATNVEILYSDSAHVRVRVTGPTMLNHLDRRDPHQEFPDGLVVDFFGEGKEVESRLTAKYGVRYPNEGLVIVRDSVVWQSIEQEKLETSELRWDERQKKVYTNKFVRITRPDEIVYGHGFEANQDFSYSKIQAIEGRIKVEDLSKEVE
jgi:LPS export ABC transporter protein LptC